MLSNIYKCIVHIGVDNTETNTLDSNCEIHSVTDVQVIQTLWPPGLVVRQEFYNIDMVLTKNNNWCKQHFPKVPKVNNIFGEQQV